MSTLISILFMTAGLAGALTQQCTGDAVDEGGNWFCGPVNHILYSGLVGRGTFRTVTYMGADGQCLMEDKAFGGPLAPLDEDLSIHFRGPIQVKEVAVYNVKLPPTKMRMRKPAPKLHGHDHRLFHRQRAATGRLAAPTVLPSSPEQGPSGGTHGKAPPGPNNNTVPAGGGEWDRIAYYNAEKQIANNVVFLGNYGGQGSGVWDAVWGNSLAFLNSQGTGATRFPQILRDVYIPSNKEFAIFSGQKCDKSCGFVRNSETAYKGFAGANKVFLFRFKMPLDGERGFNKDMSSLWFLNGRIPRTAQYHYCNCWVSGCGEVDIFEVLAPGDVKCKSTFHLAHGQGSSDYFERPVDKFIKVAVVFDEKTASVSIRVLPDETDFSTGLDAKIVEDWIFDSNGTLASSLFQFS